MITDKEVAYAENIWRDYQEKNDVTDQKGQTVGIDYKSGKIWFGKSASDIVSKRAEKGLDNPLYFIRVGYDYYLRKGYHP